MAEQGATGILIAHVAQPILASAGCLGAIAKTCEIRWPKGICDAIRITGQSVRALENFVGRIEWVYTAFDMPWEGYDVSGRGGLASCDDGSAFRQMSFERITGSAGESGRWLNASAQMMLEGDAYPDDKAMMNAV